MLPAGLSHGARRRGSRRDQPRASIEFDGNGRMYVGEMISYMMDADASREHDPISRISRWESTKGDGAYDKHTVFADKLVAPRMILPLQDGVILTSETDSDDIVKWTDTNGDGVADKREVVFTGIGQSGDANIEHQKAGLLWNMDNWIYTTYNPFRIRWTPSGFLREPTGPNGGQWGLASDDDGKPWFVDAGGERGPMNFQFPIHYGAFTPCPAAAGRITGVPRRRAAAAAPPNPNCPPGMENGFEKDFAVVWPAPGIGDMQGGIRRIRMPAQNLNHFTAATGPAIFRGDGLPADMNGNLLFTEPVGRLIRRADVENIEGLTELRNVYPDAEFLTSADQLFRPGEHQQRAGRHALHRRHVSRHHPGAAVVGPRQLPAREDRAVSARQGRDHGRIWRLRYDGRPAVPATRHQHRPAGDSGDHAELRAAAHVQRDAGAARRALHESERLVARHGAAAARPEAGQVGRAGAAADGAHLRQPARALPRAVDARRPWRARPRARARGDGGQEPAHARPGHSRERDALQGRRQVVRRRLSRAHQGSGHRTSPFRRC